MELDRFEYEMLDALLEAFGQNKSLTREQVLDIFDHDEDYAASMIGFLESNGLVTVVGNRLPLIINKEPRAVMFLANGGFVSSNDELVETEEPATETEQLKEGDLKPQEKKSNYEHTFEEHDKRIRSLELRIKRFEYLKFLLWGCRTRNIGISRLHC
ncbi:MAG: hypothetical protein JWQ63_3227 [Mucilaginibacter sp.]|nr:hypothetical protein [Mucilaginibacter sp.]